MKMHITNIMNQNNLFLKVVVGLCDVCVMPTRGAYSHRITDLTGKICIWDSMTILDGIIMIYNLSIILCNAHFNWLQCKLPGKVILASPYPAVHT